MALDETEMAEAIHVAFGYIVPPAPGNTPIPSQIIGWSKAVIDELKVGVATTGGVAGPHSISGLDGTSLANRIKTEAGYPNITSQLQNYADALVGYITQYAQVFYLGPSSGSPDWFQGGTIQNMTGTAMAAAVADGTGLFPILPGVPFPYVSSELENKCTAIVDYIQNNAEVENGVIS